MISAFSHPLLSPQPNIGSPDPVFGNCAVYWGDKMQLSNRAQRRRSEGAATAGASSGTGGHTRRLLGGSDRTRERAELQSGAMTAPGTSAPCKTPLPAGTCSKTAVGLLREAAGIRKAAAGQFLRGDATFAPGLGGNHTGRRRQGSGSGLSTGRAWLEGTRLETQVSIMGRHRTAGERQQLEMASTYRACLWTQPHPRPQRGLSCSCIPESRGCCPLHHARWG